MRLTSVLLSPGEIVTEQYPENRATLKLPKRAKVKCTSDDETSSLHRAGFVKTVVLMVIQVITQGVNEEGKAIRVMINIFHLSMCTFCGLCVKDCPSNALAFSNNFELAVFDRNKLTKVLNRPGSSLKKENKAS